MNKTLYIIIRCDTQHISVVTAATPICESEEEALQMMPRIIEEDSERVDCDYDLDVIIEGALEGLGNRGWFEFDEAALVYNMVEVDTEAPEAITEPTPGQKYRLWLEDFITGLKLRKVKDWYPKDFCIGALQQMDEAIPSDRMRIMGFDDMVFPINWKEFFTTGKTVFEDVEGNEIEFNFELDRSDMHINLLVRVNNDVKSGQSDLDINYESESKIMKEASEHLGYLCMKYLKTIHPEFAEPFEY